MFYFMFQLELVHDRVHSRSIDENRSNLYDSIEMLRIYTWRIV
jgi:hypothetical protein